MFCHRVNISYAWINTNNYIESWHNSLKKHFFKDKQQRRLDTVIYTLVQTAIPHYQQMCIRHSMQVGRMSPGAREVLMANILASNYMDQKRAEDPQVTFLIPTADRAVFQVQSFQGPPTTYNVKIEWAQGFAGHVTSCTCLKFVQQSKCCKHIALVTFELPYTEFGQAGHWNLRDQPFLEDPSTEDTPAMAVAEPASILLFKSYMHQFNNVLSVLDDKRAFTNQEEVLGTMRRALELCNLHAPVLAEHSLSNKRKRQR